MIMVPSPLMEILSLDSRRSPFLDQDTVGLGDPSAEHFRVSEVPVNVCTDTPTDPVTARLLFKATISPSLDLIRGSKGSETKERNFCF